MELTRRWRSTVQSGTVAELAGWLGWVFLSLASGLDDFTCAGGDQRAQNETCMKVVVLQRLLLYWTTAAFAYDSSAVIITLVFSFEP